MESEEYLGWWWLPSQWEERVSGTLTFSHDAGFHLTVLGAIEEPRDPDTHYLSTMFDHGLKSFDVIHGVTTKGIKITLAGCYQQTYHFNTTGEGIVETYASEVGYFGVHFATAEDAQFHKIVLGFTHLAEWVHTSGFIQTIRNRTYETHEEFEKYEATYSIPDEIQAHTSFGQVSIDFALTHGFNLPRAVHLRQQTRVRVDFEQKQGLDWIRNSVASPLQDLFTLGTDHANSITVFTGYSHENELTTPEGKTYPLPIEIKYRSIFYEPEPEQSVQTHNMLFTLSDVEDFQKFIERWFAASDTLESVYNLYFSTRYNQKIYLEHRFLSLIQACEAFHRRRWNNSVLPRDQHKVRVNAVLQTAPEEHKQWLSGVLNFSNEPRLQQRLEALVAYISPVLDPLTKDTSSFIRDVKQLRNYYAHHDKDASRIATDIETVYWLSETLSVLLQACLLHELSFPIEKIALLLQQTRQYQAIARHIRDTG